MSASLLEVIAPSAFACGHPRNEGNSYVFEGHARCRACHKLKRDLAAAIKQSMDPDSRDLAAARERAKVRHAGKPFSVVRRSPRRGRNKRIKALLAAEGPMTSTQIADALGESVRHVQWALGQMQNRLGGIRRVPDTYPALFAIWSPEQDAEDEALSVQRPCGRGSGVVAPRPYRTGYAGWGGWRG